MTYGFPRPKPSETNRMTDLVYVAICVGFFAVAIAYTYGCQKLLGGSHD